MRDKLDDILKNKFDDFSEPVDLSSWNFITQSIPTKEIPVGQTAPDTSWFLKLKSQILASPLKLAVAAVSSAVVVGLSAIIISNNHGDVNTTQEAHHLEIQDSEIIDDSIFQKDPVALSEEFEDSDIDNEPFKGQENSDQSEKYLSQVKESRFSNAASSKRQSDAEKISEKNKTAPTKLDNQLNHTNSKMTRVDRSSIAYHEWNKDTRADNDEDEERLMQEQNNTSVSFLKGKELVNTVDLTVPSFSMPENVQGKIALNNDKIPEKTNGTPDEQSISVQEGKESELSLLNVKETSDNKEDKAKLDVDVKRHIRKSLRKSKGNIFERSKDLLTQLDFSQIKINQLSAEALGSVDYAYRNYSNTSPEKGMLSDIKALEKPKIGNSFGLNINLHFSDRVNVGVGVLYTNMGSVYRNTFKSTKVEEQIRYEPYTVIKIDSVKYSYYDSLYGYQSGYKHDTTYIKEQRERKHYSYRDIINNKKVNRNYNYIGIPVTLAYSLGGKNKRVNVFSGFIFNLLNGPKTIYLLHWDAASPDSPYMVKSSLRRVNVMYWGGVEVNFPLSERIKLITGSTLKYSLTSANSRGESYSEKPYSIGVQARLRYYF